MAQSLVQLNAPIDKRGRVIGLFNMASLGLRAFSGVSVGMLGSAIGIHWSLALSAATMAVAGGIAGHTLRRAGAFAPRQVPPCENEWFDPWNRLLQGLPTAAQHSLKTAQILSFPGSRAP